MKTRHSKNKPLLKPASSASYLATLAVFLVALTCAPTAGAQTELSLVDANQRQAASTVNCDAPLSGNHCIRGTFYESRTFPGGTTITVTEADLAAMGLSGCNVLDVNVGLELSSVPNVGLDTVTVTHDLDDVVIYRPSICGGDTMDGIFDDEGGRANPCLPVGGPFIPHDLLSDFDGRSLVGDWDVSVGASAGTIESWAFAADVQCNEMSPPDSALTQKTSTCEAGPKTLCLGDDRFRVYVQWRDNTGQTGAANAIELTADTGTHWFFKSTNLEMMLKILDGCPSNNHFWVFAGGLTNVEVKMTITDTFTGVVKTYWNPQQTAFQPIQDTSAFATCDGNPPPPGEQPPPPEPSIFCDRELCATNEALRQECIDEFLFCLNAQEFNDDECVIAALLTCNAE
jgi:hypothetical protein